MHGRAQGYPRAPACALLTQAGGCRWVTRVRGMHRLEWRQHAREHLESQILLVAQAVGTALDDPNLVVQALDESERHLVLGFAVGGDSVPMSIDHLGEFLVGFEALPLQTRPPVLEEAPRPALALVVPELTEGLPEQVRRVQALVRHQHLLERLAAFEREVLATRKQRVLLALDVASILATESAVLGLAHLVERIAQMAHDVELVVQDRCLRGTRLRHVEKRLPHVHYRQANAPGLLLAQPVVEQRHARLFAVRSAEPDGALSDQVAHHDAVGLPLANRDLVDTDGFGSGRAHTGQLCPHVLLLQILDCVPVKMQLLRNVLYRGCSTAPPNVVGKALGVMGVVGQERESLAFHLATTAAIDPPHLEFEKDARIPVGQIACLTHRAIVPAVMHRPAGAADFFLSAEQA